MSRRVVVSGLGLVCPLGSSPATAVRRWCRDETDFRLLHGWKVAAVSDSFDARPYFTAPKAMKLTDRKTRFAVAAAALAMKDAGLGTSGGEDFGVIVGTGVSDQQPAEIARALGYDPELRSALDIHEFSRRILSGLTPLWLLIDLPNMVSAHLAIQFQLKGINNTLMSDWIAGSQAIGEAFHAVRRGEAEVVLAGGADSGLFEQAHVGYQQAGLPVGSRMVLSEGAAFLVLEDRQHALERNACLYAEVSAYACRSGSVEELESGGSMERSMRAVFEATGWEKTDLAALLCAAVPTSPHRQAERRALTKLFGRSNPPLLDGKRVLGHALAASGPIETALILHYFRQAPVPNAKSALICNAIGFSGQAVSLAFQLGVPKVAAVSTGH